ncbi:MAG: type II secretion system protein [Rickettsiales bacterium]|nr:type II secretion system protein [Rickettsiales bacterium]
MRNNKGFTLLELSIVIVIIGFLTSSSLTMTKGIVNVEKQRLTKERIYKIESAINAFVIKNGRLPCPSGIKEKYTSSSTIEEKFGGDNCTTSDSSGIRSSGNVYIGAVPVDSLGLQKNVAEDGWSNKFTYVVVKDYSSKGGLTKEVNDSNKINNGFAYAVISSGRHQYYSYGFGGDKEKKAVSGNDKDKSNSYSYITGNKINESWGDADFDDFTFLKSMEVIKQELGAFDIGCSVDSSKLESEKNEKCDDGDERYSFSYTPTSMKYGEMFYSEYVYKKKTVNVEEDENGVVTKTKTVVTSINRCVVECSKYGEIVVYKHTQNM